MPHQPARPWLLSIPFLLRPGLLCPARPVACNAAQPDPKWRMSQGTVLYALGWGKLRWGGSLPKYLQEVRRWRCAGGDVMAFGAG